MKYFFAAILLFLLALNAHAQPLPVAGMDSTNHVVRLYPSQNVFDLRIPNTSTGTITSWRYVLKHSFGLNITDVTLTAPHTEWYYYYNAPAPNTRLRLMQIVTNASGSDSVEFEFDVNCSVVTPPISYSIGSYIAGGVTEFCGLTTDFVNVQDVQVSGPYLMSISGGNHTQRVCGMDTFSLPGPVTVCAYYFNGTCAGFSHSTCENFNIPCWQNPVVAFTSQLNGQQVQFQSTVTATNGATYSWDLGDGNTTGGNGPMHTYSVPGHYTVCLTVTDTCGVTTTCEDLYVGIAATERPEINNFNCLPNPSNGRFLLSYEAMEMGEYRLQVSDLCGRVLHSEGWVDAMGNVARGVDLEVAAGTYLLSLTAASGAQSRRRIVVE